MNPVGPWVLNFKTTNRARFCFFFLTNFFFSFAFFRIDLTKVFILYFAMFTNLNVIGIDVFIYSVNIVYIANES